MTFEDWLKQSCFQNITQEAEDLARSAYRYAERRASLKEVEIAVALTESGYQSKRAKLKKQVTHFIGKFNIVKAENNALRKKNVTFEYRLKHHVAEVTRLQERINDIEQALKKQKMITNKEVQDAVERYYNVRV